MLIAPDERVKYASSGCGEHAIALPNPAAEACLLTECHRITFVNYLHICLRWTDISELERALGFVETFRTPKHGKPDHVEVTLGPLILGLASKEAGMRMHGLPLGPGGFPRAELVVWTDNVDEAYALLIERGVPSVSAPHDFLSSLRAAWVMDPDGNPVEIVSRRVAHNESQMGE